MPATSPTRLFRQAALAGLALLLTAAAVESQAASYRYGAIAMNKYNGRTGYAYNHYSIRSAERDAIARCGSDCQSMMWFRNGCGAVAFGANGRYGVGSAPSRAGAEQKAIDGCGLASCRVQAWACTDR